MIVDYAHSSDALENVIQTVREFVKGRVITLFGCGGDRDPSKRTVMGRIAGIQIVVFIQALVDDLTKPLFI